MQILNYQRNDPARKRRLRITYIALASTCLASIAAAGWVFASRRNAAAAAAAVSSGGYAMDEEKPRHWGSYANLHETIVNRFVSSEGFGDARLMEELYWTINSTIEVKGKTYWVGPVQLISLNNGSDPFIYTDERQASPFKKELKHLKHAQLDEAQLAALKQLTDGKEVVQTGSGDKIRLVGAVRASKQCLTCHEVEEGALLGAFNYPLEAVNLKK